MSVGDVSFTNEDSHVISVGRDDRCVMQWRHTPDDVIDDADVVDEPESDDYALELRDGSDFEHTPEHQVSDVWIRTVKIDVWVWICGDVYRHCVWSA